MTAATMTEARAMVAAMDVRAMLLVTTATTAEAMVTAMAVMHYGGCGVACEPRSGLQVNSDQYGNNTTVTNVAVLFAKHLL